MNTRQERIDHEISAVERVVLTRGGDHGLPLSHVRELVRTSGHDLSATQIRERLTRLMKEGRITRVGKRKGAKYKPTRTGRPCKVRLDGTLDQQADQLLEVLNSKGMTDFVANDVTRNVRGLNRNTRWHLLKRLRERGDIKMHGSKRAAAYKVASRGKAAIVQEIRTLTEQLMETVAKL